MKTFETLQERLNVVYQKSPKAILGAGALIFLLIGIFALSDDTQELKRVADLTK